MEKRGWPNCVKDDYWRIIGEVGYGQLREKFIKTVVSAYTWIELIY